MKFRPGDKVKLLNEKGEGLVCKVSGKMIYVELEDGFEVPFSPEELVKIEQEQAGVEEDQQTKYEPASIPESSRVKVREGVSLVFIPEDDADLLAATLQLYLINHTGYSIFYTCSIKENENYRLISADNINAYEKIFLTEIERGDLDKYSNLKADILFFKDQPFREIAPTTKIIKLKAVKFYKESTYEPNPWFSSPGYIVEVWNPFENIKPIAHDLNKIIFEKENKYEKQISKRHTGLLEEEVDLHIEELIDDMKGLSNAEMINIQLKHFQSRLDAAIANNVKKIVFIHGVGNGRLKYEVRKMLEAYRGVSFRDASFQRYGFGATEVLIK